MLRSEVTAERFHERQAECLPGKYGVVVTRIAEGRLDAELTLQPWMMAPNGFLHAASVLLLADTAAGYASIAHLPENAKNFTTVELKTQLPRHRARREDPHRVRGGAPRADDARLVGDRVRARRQADRAVPLHAADPVVSARRPGAARGAGRGRAHEAVRAPMDDREIEELQALLDSVPAPFEPLDVSSLDGFLCGVIVQPEVVPSARWLPFVTDVDGRAFPPPSTRAACTPSRCGATPELRRAIGRRPGSTRGSSSSTTRTTSASMGTSSRGSRRRRRPGAVDAVYPWVAGFAAALETFPGLLAGDEAALTGPLALIYRHLGADDLEDADALLAEIESLEPPADLAAAVEELVRATLLLAGRGRRAARALSAAPSDRQRVDVDRPAQHAPRQRRHERDGARRGAAARRAASPAGVAATPTR
jgi:uncharacterized protein